MKKPTLYVDADACPVKEELLKVSYRHQLQVYLVSNQWLRLEVGPLVEKIVVPEGPDVADDWIAERAGEGDIVITQDIPLADKAIKAGALAIGNTGKPFTTDNIGMALAMRDLKQHLRETGEGGNYNAAFSKADRSRFLQELDKMVLQLMRS
ncbi:YaiI/YqxD family protein [Temperatibacter marinus]|uniref:UPF0178 protein QGN29_02600 n=1 Tax=Temperatibacter marinus TaxID=1456591 RepID=A0AA52EHI0_9PROT|nr:YaiI/YqxD family protein [Temperatibacter marinus]WND03258.1 YaiI/YqxD family protein [Temperatibacter marinus]